MNKEEAQTMRDHLDSLSYPDLAQAMLDAKAAHIRAKAVSTELNDVYELIARQVIPARMDRDKIQNITVKLSDGTNRRLQINSKISVKTPAEKKYELWDWLRDHDAGNIISETVNASTLAAYVGEQMRQGEPYPIDICTVSVYEVASLIKAS